MLKNKTIIIGITGCIAAYKSAEIIRELKKLNADVWVAMTKEAAEFVTPLTFRTLSKNPVITNLFSEELSNNPVPHVSLTEKADLIIVAPATANILGKISSGIADDPLSTIIMAADCPVVFAPAMNSKMWNNEATRDNVSKLKLRGYKFINPGYGFLACGDAGIGRLADIGLIISETKNLLLPSQDLSGKNIVITAGPTRENIDPVRFISNRSSGKMGYAIAEAAARRGANVTLISGPTNLVCPPEVNLINIETAEEMNKTINSRFEETDILIMAAAVADFKPGTPEIKKIKKINMKNSLRLEKTNDILKELGNRKNKQVLIGFSLESDNLIENAKAKLVQKNLDAIIANSIEALGSNKNEITIINKNGAVKPFEKKDKKELADKIIDCALEIISSKHETLRLVKTRDE